MKRKMGKSTLTARKTFLQMKNESTTEERQKKMPWAIFVKWKLSTSSFPFLLHHTHTHFHTACTTAFCTFLLPVLQLSLLPFLLDVAAALCFFKVSDADDDAELGITVFVAAAAAAAVVNDHYLALWLRKREKRAEWKKSLVRPSGS